MKRLAIITGLRSPMTKSGTVLKDAQVDDLAAYVFREVMHRSNIHWKDVDEVILGNVAQPAHSANVSRVAALKAGLPIETPAYTVHRNCASGMQSITEAVDKIRAGYGSVFLVGGAESMSNIPLLFNREYIAFIERLMRAKTGLKKIKALLRFKFHMFKPDIGLIQGLTDPVSGLIMGLTAENLAREFHISREEQDEFALRSHRLASEAQKKGVFDDEIVPIPTFPHYRDIVTQDIGPRANQTIEALAKLKPYFDRRNGTVTIGNSCQVTDGAAALLITSETEAKKRGIEPLGYIREYAYASLDPHRMGLGPVYATARLMDRAKFSMGDIKYIEINEAFAAQVIACERAFDSDTFANTFLDRDKKLGAIDRNILNVHGGAIALGHPVGMTGTRIVLHTLKELRRRKENTGLASLCVGGGQGAAFLLEVA